MKLLVRIAHQHSRLLHQTPARTVEVLLLSLEVFDQARGRVLSLRLAAQVVSNVVSQRDDLSHARIQQRVHPILAALHPQTHRHAEPQDRHVFLLPRVRQDARLDGDAGEAADVGFERLVLLRELMALEDDADSCRYNFNLRMKKQYVHE